MKNSSTRILTTHVGSLARPQEVIDVMRAKETGQPYDAQQLATLLRYSVGQVVRRQVEAGIDVPQRWRVRQEQLLQLRPRPPHRFRTRPRCPR